MRDDGAFHGKALDVFRFPRQKRLRNQQRKVRVDVPGILEAAVQVALDCLPDGEAFRPDDHAALHRRVVGQFRALDNIFLAMKIPVMKKASLCTRGQGLTQADAAINAGRSA